MQMLKVISLPAPKGPVPDGMKVTAISNPDTTQSAPTSPVLAVGGFICWPMSYYDNRVSFGIVMYDLKWRVVNTLEKPGARYIYKITLEGRDDTGSVTFWGQANQKVTMSLDEVCQMLFPKG